MTGGGPLNMTDVWTCPTCAQPQSASYCPNCGDQRLRPHDLTLRDVAVQATQSLSNLDSKLLRSFLTLIVKPGVLTRAHVRGQRRAWLGPAQVFFTVNVLFFATQSLAHVDIFSSSLDSHLHHQDWSPLAQTMVTDRLASENLSLASYAPRFNQAVLFNAKALIILMVAAFTPFVMLLFHGKNRPVGHHVVFSLHTYAFVLLLICLSMGIAGLSVALGGPGLSAGPLDTALSLFNVAVCGLYLYFAVHTAYGETGWRRLAKTVALTAALAVITVGYRFTIFLITVTTS